jgi:hypothetical protein
LIGFAHILAKTDLGGLIIFLIVLAFWGLSALSNWIKKAQEEAQRQRVRQTIAQANAMTPDVARRNLPRAKPPWRPPPVQAQRKPAAAPRAPMPPRQAQMQPKRAQARQRQAPARKTTPPPIPVIDSVQLLPATKQDISATEISSTAPTSPSAAHSLAANASTLHRWLRPATLRQQFILTEVLQPPLALRDPPSHG